MDTELQLKRFGVHQSEERFKRSEKIAKSGGEQQEKNCDKLYFNLQIRIDRGKKCQIGGIREKRLRSSTDLPFINHQGQYLYVSNCGRSAVLQRGNKL